MVLHLLKLRARKEAAARLSHLNSLNHGTLCMCLLVATVAWIRSAAVLYFVLFKHEQLLIQEAFQPDTARDALSHELTISLVHAVTAAAALAAPPMQLLVLPGGSGHVMLGCVYCGALSVAMPTAVSLSLDRDDAPLAFAGMAVACYCMMVVGVAQLILKDVQRHSLWMRWSHVTLMLGFAMVQTADQVEINSWSRLYLVDSLGNQFSFAH
eukprot:TRINITY_DN3421_c0_g1_i1.p1 TRINITY_DN3421_c0_g1~~TRINITY_DN3421_c0_g1_i1.p1  ORF type:complete len:211 (-),score=46.98 TRINITY_DN3421_c0_g1_i1:206-838(-)